VRVAQVVEDAAAPHRRFEPSHPDADAEGYVSLPNVDPAEEMVDMLGAARAYQANLTAIGLIKDLIQRALELGRVRHVWPSTSSQGSAAPSRPRRRSARTRTPARAPDSATPSIVSFRRSRT